MPKVSNVSSEIVVITTELARKYLGAREIEGDEKPQIKVYKGEDVEKLIFVNSATNRPFRVSLANRYAEDMITQRWAGMKNSKSKTINGETIIIDANGQLVSGQHRLAALLLAEDKRKIDPAYYKEYYGCTGPLKFPTLLVAGIDPVSADTVDMGQKRSAGDVLYRQADLFPDDNKAARTKMCRWLGAAARLAWLKMGGKQVSDAPHLPHSELLAFIDEHPNIIKCVSKIYKIEVATGHGFNSMSISQGYMASLMFLASEAQDPENPKYAAQIKHLMAWVESIASGENLKAKMPAYELRKLYMSHLKEGGSRDRDLQVVSPWIAAWNAEKSGNTITQAKLKFKVDDVLPVIEGVFYEAEDDDTDTAAPTNDAVDESPFEEPTTEPAEEPAEEQTTKPVVGSELEAGQLVQVIDADGTIWSGTISEIIDKNRTITTDEDGNDWEVAKKQILPIATDTTETADDTELEPFAQ